jgi:hypothetical protein
LPHQPRNPSSLRHATSSYELSRPTIGDSTSSKLHAWRELLKLKESRNRADREAAQLERSKLRNGYPSSYKTWSRNSSRVRGPAGDVSDDVWILPSVRPGSAGSMVRSIRMRTSSPPGSLRSQRGRPRGRDIFEAMVDEGVQTGATAGVSGLLAPPPLPAQADSRTMSVDIEREETPRRKRAGYFSAREEDLDPLDMDVEDFITPAKKKQRISVHGPKFAALWEPSKRENWPLGEDVESKMEEEKKETVEELSQKELKELDSPAFKLPPSARKEKDVLIEMEEQSSPTKEVGKPPATNGFNSGFDKPLSPERPTFSFTEERSASPDKPTFSFSMDQSAASIPSEAPKFEFKSPAAKSVETVEGPKETPSKTAAFMQSILSESNKSPEKEEVGFKPVSFDKQKENGVTEAKESQSSSPKFQFSLPPTQTTISASPPKSPIAEKPVATGGFNFGGSTSGFSFGSTATPTGSGFLFKPIVTAKETSNEEPPKPIVPTTEAPKLSFGFQKPSVEEPKAEKTEEKEQEKIEMKPAAPLFGFGKPVTEEPKKETSATPVFGARTGAFGSFGGAFPKQDAEKKPLFGSSAVAGPVDGINAETATTNGVKKPDKADAPTMPLFGGGTSSGFKFRAPVSSAPKEEPKVDLPEKVATPPPLAPSSAVLQDMDDSMDITDSPPSNRNPSIAMTDANVPFGGFKLPPTSAPVTNEASKASLFSFSAPTDSKANGTTEKPPFTFETSTSENKPLFGTAPAATSAAFGSPAVSPVPTGFGGFGSAFSKKEEPVQAERPASQPFSFQSTGNASTMSFGGSGAPATTETKPLFGSQPAPPASAPAFGGPSTSLFGGSSGFQPQPTSSVTSPPAVSTAPASTSAFSFNFNAPSTDVAPSFGSSSTPFTFGASSNAPVNNPFAAQLQPAVTTPGGFQGISSAPVSPQAQQTATFPNVQSPFGGPALQSAPLFGGGNPSAQNFQFSSGNIPGTPVFTLGANTMQRSSSDAGPGNASPGGRKIAQPRRRLPRR